MSRPLSRRADGLTETAGGPAAAAPHSSLRATLIGGIAVLMWATLALLTTGTGSVPPFLVTALSFAIAFLVALTKWLIRGEDIVRHLRQPLIVWAIGVGGLFGFHALYFLALKLAPPVEASLIVYLWPLLIVVFSALLPGERLRWWHAAGAFLGLAGAVLLIGGGKELTFRGGDAFGYAAALAAAITWATYSVLSRRFGSVPTDAVGGFCGATALLAFICHLAVEPRTVPQSGEWLAILGLGIGPVGIAFFVWDHGVKHGSIRALGGVSYATPLLSTLLLIVFGRAIASVALLAACVLIVSGAVLASRDLWGRRGAPAGD